MNRAVSKGSTDPPSLLYDQVNEKAPQSRCEFIVNRSLSPVHAETIVFDASLMLIDPPVKGVLGIVRVAVAHGYEILTSKVSVFVIEE